MNLDRFSIYLSISFLPLLFLPRDYLPFAIFLAFVWAFFNLMRKHYWHMGLGILMGISYLSISHTVKIAENQPASKVKETIEIVKILKQQEYQTAIGKLANDQQIYLTWQAQTPLYLHRKYTVDFTLRPISGRYNLGNFDRQRWYFANHIDGIATVRKAELLEEFDAPFRTQWLNRSYQQTAELDSQGLLLALAFGERAWLKNEHWLPFQKTATAHLIAISGLHIALALAFGFLLAKGVQWCLLKGQIGISLGYSYLFPRLFGFVIAFGYSYLAGFSAPTLRALLAMAVLLSCQIFRRRYTSLQIWWRVVALLLVFEPVAILSDSFWLSILAVLSLILWYRYFPLAQFSWIPFSQTQHKIGKVIVSLLHLQIGIWLIFSPVQFFFLAGTSPLSLPANMLIVPLYSMVLVPIILFTLLTDNLFSTWGLADYIAQFSLWLLKPLSNAWYDLSLWQQGQILFINGTVLFGLYMKNSQKAKSFLYKGIAVFSSAYVVFCLYSWRETPVEWITFDVGQGLAQAIVYQDTSGQKQAIFYDTGVSWGEGEQKNSMAKLEILPYLKRHNIQVQAIFLSHDDNDHSGGVLDLLTAYPHAEIFSSSRLAYADVQPQSCLAGDKWQFGELQFMAVYPTQRVEKAQNQDSCILLVKINRFTLLLTGDTGVEQERIFSSSLGQIDFLQIAHHGSKTSTSEVLLAKTRPTLAVVSTGRWNPWKMPNKTVVERLLRYQVPLLNTAKEGMIRVTFHQDHWSVETGRNAFSAWYQGYFESKASHSK